MGGVLLVTKGLTMGNAANQTWDDKTEDLPPNMPRPGGMVYCVLSDAGCDSFTDPPRESRHGEAVAHFEALRAAGRFGHVELYRLSVADAGDGHRLARYEYRKPTGCGAPGKLAPRDESPRWGFFMVKRKAWPKLFLEMLP